MCSQWLVILTTMVCILYNRVSSHPLHHRSSIMSSTASPSTPRRLRRRPTFSPKKRVVARVWTDVDGKHEVKRIIASKGEGAKLQYRVEWMGYPASRATWMPADRLWQAKIAIEAYLRTLRVDITMPAPVIVPAISLVAPLRDRIESDSPSVDVAEDVCMLRHLTCEFIDVATCVGVFRHCDLLESLAFKINMSKTSIPAIIGDLEIVFDECVSLKQLSVVIRVKKCITSWNQYMIVSSIMKSEIVAGATMKGVVVDVRISKLSEDGRDYE